MFFSRNKKESDSVRNTFLLLLFFIFYFLNFFFIKLGEYILCNYDIILIVHSIKKVVSSKKRRRYYRPADGAWRPGPAWGLSPAPPDLVVKVAAVLDPVLPGVPPAVGVPPPPGKTPVLTAPASTQSWQDQGTALKGLNKVEVHKNMSSFNARLKFFVKF